VRLASIQIMRGIAAMMIFLFHLLLTVDRYSQFKFRPHIQVLSSGVAIFFLISGFVMAHSVRNIDGPVNAAHFLIRRIWRILPVLYIVTAACAGLMLSRGEYIEPARLLNSLAVFTLFPTINKFSLVLLPAWSLAYEMGFYLVVTAVVAFRFNRLGLMVVTTMFALIFPLMSDFAIGVGLYELWTRFPAMASRSLEWSPSSRAGKAGLWLGAISYSLYLSHVVTFDALAPLLALVIPPFAMIPFLAVAGITIAWLFYEAVEAPLMRMRPYPVSKAPFGGTKLAV